MNELTLKLLDDIIHDEIHQLIISLQCTRYYSRQLGLGSHRARDLELTFSTTCELDLDTLVDICCQV